MNPGTLFSLAQTPCLVLFHLEDLDTFIIVLLPFTLLHQINLLVTLNCLVHKLLEL
jgi:hypothetical protein